MVQKLYKTRLQRHEMKARKKDDDELAANRTGIERTLELKHKHMEEHQSIQQQKQD